MASTAHDRCFPRSSLPFEIWRIILQDVFHHETVISHPPNSHYTISTLHSRLLIFSSLIVCKSWHKLALDVFMEDLQADTVESLQGRGNHMGKTTLLLIFTNNDFFTRYIGYD